jgi:glucose/arabinose dehydrogenase
MNKRHHTVGFGAGASLATAMLCACVIAFGAALLVFSADEANGAARLPQNFSQKRVATGMQGPTAMAMAPDGRMLVTQKQGQVRIIKGGRLLGAAAVNIGARVDTAGERGLLGVALDPQFRYNRFVYLYYTQKAVGGTPAHNRVSRFRVSGDRILASSEQIIQRLDNLSATNHNGGAIHFGRDGKLYVAVGENAVPSNSQSLGNRLGKMLRINKDGTIPTDNPFYGRALGPNRAIWALGLRNPYTFAVQPGSGRIFINDVGQDSFEEINAGSAGANYGWPVYEGRENDPMYTSPIFAYGHGRSATKGCAITGGAFYNPRVRDFPVSFIGDYFFADICSGWIRRFDSQTRTTTGFAIGAQQPVDLLVGSGGNLYYLELGTGSIYRVRYGAR